jgi:enoyl-CoA hydratase/carnithine racemase
MRRSARAPINEVAAGNRAALWAEPEGWLGLTHARRRKPWIAALNGSAHGGGVELALSCDMIVAADHATLALPEVTRGIMAAAGGAFRLVRALPDAVATELLLTGRPIAAQHAYRWGMINRLCRRGEALATALELASQIVRNAPIAVRETLAIARTVRSQDEGQLWQRLEEARQRMNASEDSREGPRGLLERRPPQWRGR